MSRGFSIALSTHTRRSFTLFWAVLFVLSLALQYGSALAPQRVLGAPATPDFSAGTFAGFEIDGDLLANNASTNPGGLDASDVFGGLAGLVNGDDWLSPTPAGVTFKNDLSDSTLDDGFGGGSKDLDTRTWSYLTGKITPAKTDLDHVMAHPKVLGSDTLLFVGATRLSITGGGAAHLTVELNRLPWTTWSGVEKPNRSVGDVFIDLDFETGGKNPVVSIYKVTEITATSAAGQDVAIGPNIASTAGIRSAIYSKAEDLTIPFADGNQTIKTNGFAEFGINLTELGIDTSCPGLGTANIRSRSGGEDLGSSQLQDFTGQFPIDLNDCGKLRIEKRAESATGALLGGATFTVTPDPRPDFNPDLVTVVDNATTDTVTHAKDSNAANGIIEIDPAKPGTYTICETVAPAGYDLPNPACQSGVVLPANGTATVVFVDTPTPAPAINIDKEADETALGVGGGLVTYTYTVTNTGNVPLSNVTVVDKLTGTNTNACSPLSAPTGDTNTDSKLDTTETWVYTCSANIAVNTDNTATATGHYGQTTVTDSDIWTVTVEPSAPNVNVVKSVSSTSDRTGATANPGDRLSYAISIQNVGNATATVDVSDDINDLLAHGDYNLDASPSVTSYSGGVLFWNDVSVGAGQTVTVTYSVDLDATFPQGTTHLPNVVVVVGPGSNCAAESEDPDCDTDTTVDANPNLVVEKSIGGEHQTTANPGATITYTITVKNTGDADATDVVVTDDISDVLAHASYVSCTDTCSGPDAGDVLSWTLATVAAGVTETVEFTVTLDSTGFPVNQTVSLPNTVVVDDSNCDVESDDPDCSTDTTVLVPGNPAVTISKLVNGKDSVLITGGTATALTYTILVSNAGTAPTTMDYVVTDSAFPSFYSITGVSWTKNGVTTPSTSGALLGGGINIGVLAADDKAATGNDEVTVTVTGSAAPAAASSGPHVNTAFACPATDNETRFVTSEDCVDDTASISVTYSPPPQLGSLTITKVVNPAEDFRGGTFKFDVSCAPQQTITLAAGEGTKSVTINNLPLGASCTVTEVTPLTAGPGWQWIGQPSYAPGQTVSVPGTVTVTNTWGEVAAATATPRVTPPPTTTAGEGTANPGSNLGLALAALALFGLVLGVLAPKPARARRRSR